MGRITATQSAGSSRTVTVSPTTTALTTVYTNASGAGAELKAVNINGQQNRSTLQTAGTGASEWTFQGSNIQVLIQAQQEGSYGFGEPYPVQLTDNRVLIFFLPHQQHRGGDLDFFSGTMIHTQILEYQTNKYVAGPIQNHTLPGVMFQNMSYSLWSQPEGTTPSTVGEPCWRARALTANKVAAVVRIRSQFWLMRFTITGNTVNHTVTSLDLTVAAAMNMTTAYPFAMDTVPGNTNQVIIAAADASNWTVQSHNVPDSGALSIASAKQTLWATGGGYHSIGLTKMVRTATGDTVPYCMAAPTSTTASNGVIYNYDHAASTWTIAGTNQSLTAISTNHSGFSGMCLSTGTEVNAVMATTTGSGAGDGLVAFYRQISAAGFSNVRTTLTTQHTTYKRLTESFQWGNERAIFTGHNGLLVQYDSAGVATNLINPITDSVNTERWRPHWYPFNSRPLYTYYDDGTRDASYNIAFSSRTGMSSATDPGRRTLTGNYLPYGHDYGNGYAWNEPASCWIFAQGGRLYALSESGVIQSEQNIYNMSTTLNYLWCTRQVTVTPTGRILFSCDYGLGIHVSTSYSVTTQWNSMTATIYQMVTEPMTEATGLNSLRLQQAPNNASGYVSGNIVSFADATGTEMAYMCYIYSGGTSLYITWFNGTAWQGATYSTSTPISTGTWGKGYRMNFRLMQATPANNQFPNGEWIMMGSYASNSAANYAQAGLSVRYAFGSFSSFNTQSVQLDSVSVTEGWGIGMWTHNGRASGVSVAAQYEDTQQTLRVWSSFNGRLQRYRGNVDAIKSVNHRWGECAVSKFGYVIAYQNTSRAPQTVRAEVWNTIDSVNYVAQQTTASGSGWFQLGQANKNSMAIFNTTGATTINTVYGFYGLPDNVRFYIALDDNAGSVFYLNNGQSLTLTDLQSVFRSDVDFQVPMGHSLKVAIDTPYTANLLLSLVER